MNVFEKFLLVVIFFITILMFIVAWKLDGYINKIDEQKSLITQLEQEKENYGRGCKMAIETILLYNKNNNQNVCPTK